MKQYIKPTCVILTLVGTFFAGVESRPLIEAHFATDNAPKQAAKANYAPKEYGMNELVNHVQSAQFIDIPEKPVTR
jgi:hypothetical protein